MKFRVFIIAIQFSCSSILFAQESKPFDLFGNLGFSWPDQPSAFANDWKMGFNLGAGFGYRWIPDVNLFAQLDFNSFLVDQAVSNVVSNLQLLTLTANVKFDLLTILKETTPYITLGAGYSRQWGPGQSKGAFPVLVGLGLNMGTSPNSAVFIDGKYGMCIQSGDDLNFFALRIGTRWNFN